MNSKILTLLIVFGLLAPTAMALGDPSPKPFTVNFITTTVDTSFSVSTNTPELNFTSNNNTNSVLPVGGDPWGTITNEASVALNFSVKIDSQPLNIKLMMGSSAGSGAPIDLIQVTENAAALI